MGDENLRGQIKAYVGVNPRNRLVGIYNSSTPLYYLLNSFSIPSPRAVAFFHDYFSPLIVVMHADAVYSANKSIGYLGVPKGGRTPVSDFEETVSGSTSLESSGSYIDELKSATSNMPGSRSRSFIQILRSTSPLPSLLATPLRVSSHSIAI